MAVKLRLRRMKEVSGAMPNAETKRLIRSQLWSPVQNTSLWLAWWLHGVISTDEVIDSYHAVQGRHHRVLARAGGAVSGTAAEADEATGLIERAGQDHRQGGRYRADERSELFLRAA